MKEYVVVGQFRGGHRGPLGLKTYELDSVSGRLSERFTGFPEVAAGAVCISADGKTVYAVDERSSLSGTLGGGSYVYAFRLNPEDGSLTLLSKVRSFSSCPSSLCLDPEEHYLVVCCNSDSGYVTRIRRLSNGTFDTETVYNDAAVVLYPVDDDGTLKEAVDVFVPENDGAASPRAVLTGQGGGILANPGVMSHCHGIARSPDGRVFAVCDFGQGKIYTFTLDPEQGRLAHRSTVLENVGYGVRYCVFHPSLPILYVNCENTPKILCYQYAPEDGSLEKLCESPTVPDESGISAGSNDLCLDPAGKRLFCSSTANMISVLRICEDGNLALEQVISSEGERPRAICPTSDGHYLLVGNNRSESMSVFRVRGDGKLKYAGRAAENLMASGICTACVDG